MTNIQEEEILRGVYEKLVPKANHQALVRFVVRHPDTDSITFNQFKEAIQLTQEKMQNQREVVEVAKQFRSVGYEEAKAETLAKVNEAIDELLAKGLNGQRYNFMINGEELKAKIKEIK